MSMTAPFIINIIWNFVMIFLNIAEILLTDAWQLFTILKKEGITYILWIQIRN